MPNLNVWIQDSIWKTVKIEKLILDVKWLNVLG